MSGDFVEESQLKLTGINKYFNSYTMRGRFNVSCSVLETNIVHTIPSKNIRRGKHKSLAIHTQSDYCIIITPNIGGVYDMFPKAAGPPSFTDKN